MGAAYNVMAVHRMMCRRSCMSILVLGELLPEGGFAAGEEGVFAGVPAKEMRGLRVKTMMFAGGPDFVEQEGAGDFEGAVQVVGEAAFFAAGGGDEGAEFCFEDEVLAFLGAEDDDQGYGVFGELGAPAGGSPTSGLTCGGRFLPFALRHCGGIVLQLGEKKMWADRRQDRHTSKRWQAIALQMRYLAADA